MNPVKGWRLLKATELHKKGDQAWDQTTDEWNTINPRAAGSLVDDIWIYRRRVSKPRKVKASKSLTQYCLIEPDGKFYVRSMSHTKKVCEITSMMCKNKSVKDLKKHGYRVAKVRIQEVE